MNINLHPFGGARFFSPLVVSTDSILFFFIKIQFVSDLELINIAFEAVAPPGELGDTLEPFPLTDFFSPDNEIVNGFILFTIPVQEIALESSPSFGRRLQSVPGTSVVWLSKSSSNLNFLLDEVCFVQFLPSPVPGTKGNTPLVTVGVPNSQDQDAGIVPIEDGGDFPSGSSVNSWYTVYDDDIVPGGGIIAINAETTFMHQSEAAFGVAVLHALIMPMGRVSLTFPVIQLPIKSVLIFYIRISAFNTDEVLDDVFKQISVELAPLGQQALSDLTAVLVGNGQYTRVAAPVAGFVPLPSDGKWKLVALHSVNLQSRCKPELCLLDRSRDTESGIKFGVGKCEQDIVH